MREGLTYLFVHQAIDNPNDPRDPRVEKQVLDYDTRGNLTHIEREINNPDMPMDASRESVQRLVWDEEDRLLGVDLRPESDREQPHIAAYTYDASGERGIRYVPRQQEGVSSGTTAGYAQDMDIMLYPNALITVRPQELPEDFDPMRIHPEHTFTTYTKHYYIGSERINSKLGTVNNLGLLCEEMRGSTALINEMNSKTQQANQQLNKLYQDLDKELVIEAPYLYSTNHSLSCGFKSHNPKLYDAYWYHPDHLGSSSFITNTTGEISQHLEYLPFGETLVEEHLNSYNSPFKFNGKEYDAETGNYYYGARYMNPKWSMWFGVDPLAEGRPEMTPYHFVSNNPINRIDPDGRWDDWVQNADGEIYWDKNATSQATTKANETYLGRDLTFTFNSYIDGNLWDGPMGSFPAGDKLTSTINVTSNTDADNNLLSVDIKSSTFVHKTGGIFQGDGYYPGQKNVNLDIKGATNGYASFEKHAKVNGFEEMGLGMMGYDKVNVAQKLTLGLNGNNLSVTGSTDIFPSATLSVNGTQLFKYNQPSFKGTHGYKRETVFGDNGMGGSTTTQSTPLRPAPAFYQRYNK